MIQRLSRFISLPAVERQLVAVAWVRLHLAWVELRTRRPLVLEHAACAPPRGGTPDPQRIAELVHAAARACLVPARCLERSLVVARLVAARGQDASLRIGFRRQGHQFDAHAWVEVAGEPLNEDPALLESLSPFGRRA